MILCDTNVLVGLVDETDELAPIAREELTRMARKTLVVTEPVLTETLHFLPTAAHRKRLEIYLHTLPIKMAPPLRSDELVLKVFAWMKQYAKHSPDWADAHLAVLSGSNPGLRIWTYDSEFQTIWRRPDGSKIPVVGKLNIRSD